MVRAMVIILVLGGIVLFCVFKFGGVGSFDPTAEGEAFKAKLTPGMTWTQVVTLKEPRKYRVFHESKRKAAGHELVQIEPGTPLDFDEVRIKKSIKDRNLPHGFLFDYRFSAQCSFEVVFDRTGALSDIRDAVTMANLLDTRD